jgi:hypothetical protein
MSCEIAISASTDEVLGGREYRPYIELELMESGNASLSTGERHSSQNGTTFDRWHGRTLAWRHSLSQGSYTLPDVMKIEALAEQVKPLLERVHAGYTTNWDGSNKGRLTEDAQEASDAIERIFEDADWCDDKHAVWDASEWIARSGYLATAREFGLTVNSGAAAWTAADAALVRQAKSDGVVLVGTDKAIERMKDALKEEAPD